jgi:hypothetical protein
LTSLRGNAGVLASWVFRNLLAALGTGVRTAAEFDSDQKRAFRFAWKTWPISGRYRDFQRTR